MRKIFLAIALLFSFTAFAQQQINTKQLTVKDSIYFDGAWHKRWPFVPQLTGGVVTWVSGLTFAVTPATYTINKREYSSAAGTITLNAADPSLPRLDVIALNTAGQIVKITGTPAASPAIPQVNPASQIYLTSVLVNAGSTTPGGGVTNVTVYDENTEWSHSQSGFTGGISFTSTTSPYTGTKSINVTGSGASDVSAAGGIKFFNGTTLYNYSDYNTLRFYIKLKAAMPTGSAIQVALGNGNEQMTILTAAHGYNPNTVGTYQNISIPLGEFNRTASTFAAFYIQVTGTGIGYYIDNVQLQAGFGGGNCNGNYITDIFRKTATDSVFKVMCNGSIIYAYKDSTGGGGSIGDLYSTNGTQTDAVRQYLLGYGTGFRSLSFGKSDGSEHSYVTIYNSSVNHYGGWIAHSHDSTSGLTFDYNNLIQNGFSTIQVSKSVNTNLSKFYPDSTSFSFNSPTKLYYKFTKDSFLIKNLPAGTGGRVLKYNTASGMFTYGDTTHVPTPAEIAQQITDSSFQVTSPVASTVAAFQAISSTILQIRGFKLGKNGKPVLNADSTISIDYVAAVGTTASGSTITINADLYDNYTITALAANATIAAPTGTLVDGQMLLIRIKDNGTSRTLTWNSIFRASTDFALPTATTISKTMYIQFVYNSADSKFDAIGLTSGF